MAKRFGGKFSPDGTTQGGDAIREAAVDERVVDAAGARATVLFVPAVIVLFTSINDGPVTLGLAVVGAAVLTLAAWLLRDGLRAAAAYDARKVARKPAIPRKMFASALTGIGIAISAYTGDSGLIGSVLYGAIASALHVTAFGIDPLTDKRMEGVDTFQQDRVARVVDQAEAHLAVMKSQIEALGDRPLQSRVLAFQAIARKMIRTVEEDPRDLTSARKFLSVYLEGAKDATIKFVDLVRRKPDPVARENYEALLTDLENNFAARTEKLLSDDRTDMDIEIKVLRDRLQREGVKPNV
ncbi:5-bromo-4-chloroindolyl phosphate hydrolysis family protein [Yoonia sp. 208BN28-4]|uniref:5-bromo-4-chloroindolyl phosphate hydrolysis family protein n=1 Tax=Yoonia sp. 208BN28-4 TaxID=3126505 RepID=UPI0030A3C1E8